MFEYWADRFLWDYSRQIDAFADTLSRRVLPGFANLDEEGKQIADEAYRELVSGYQEEPDWGSLAEQAQNEAITFYETMYGIRQGVRNMFAVGLWHLFEQQLADFVRHAILDYPRGTTRNPDFDAAQKLIGNEWHIDVTRFPSYLRLDELRLLANCAKHGDGGSCAQLRELRPALFTPFPHDTAGCLGSTPVIAPLGGEHLYVTEEDFSGTIPRAEPLGVPPEKSMGSSLRDTTRSAEGGTMFNLEVTRTTFHGEAQVISSGRSAAVVHVNAEQVWSAEELRKVAAMLESAARIMETA